MSAVVAKGLVRSFRGQGSGTVQAVRGVDLEVQERELFGIVGPDGAGKTTLLRLLVGVLAPEAGSIELLGVDLLKERNKTRALLGYMSQAFSLYPDLTVAENIAFFGSLRGVSRKDRDARAGRILEATGLAPFTKRQAGQLSGGMKQKLGLTCTLVHEPQILFLDEPTNGVDPVSRREFWAILGELRRRISIVVTTPSLDEAERCNRVALMAEGRILTVDTPEGLRARVTRPVWEVEVEQPFAAVEILDRVMPEASVQLFGDRLHVVYEAAAPILEALPGARIQQVPASLEDAYVQLVTEAAAAKAATKDGAP